MAMRARTSLGGNLTLLVSVQRHSHPQLDQKCFGQFHHQKDLMIVLAFVGVYGEDCAKPYGRLNPGPEIFIQALFGLTIHDGKGHLSHLAYEDPLALINLLGIPEVVTTTFPFCAGRRDIKEGPFMHLRLFP